MYNNDVLSTYVMYYSLFGVELFNNKKKIIDLFPKQTFGVFTTIKRRPALKTYPKDVHGCIGYWDKNFKNITSNLLYDHLLRVSNDSVYNDERRKHFKPIETEPQSILEIDFLLNPIYEIDKRNGNIIKLNKKFNNNIFGIIIQSGVKKATYLPHVFPNISWINILKSIKQKANILDLDDFNVFAYKIHQIKSNYGDFLTKIHFSNASVRKFTRFLIDNQNLKFHFPFPYESNEKDRLIWNTEEQVRNISILGSIYEYTAKFEGIAYKYEIREIKNKIITILKHLDRYNSQSLSFLGFMYNLHGIKNTEYCNKLITRLTEKDVDQDFELLEIIIGLSKAGCNFNKISATFTLDDSIFKMNWIIQVIIAYDKIPSQKLITILYYKIKNILLKKELTETNFIAVAFEALCFVFKSKFKDYKNTKLKKEILCEMFELLCELEKRKNSNNQLYSFLNKKSRIDITGHVMNGLNKLV